jgi:wengen
MKNSQCILCTKCSQHELVLRPCQLYMDTVCQPLNAIEIDWSKSMANKTPPHNHHNQHHHHQLEAESLSAHESSQVEKFAWDWQMITLVLAIFTCIMFFVGTALVSINYIRQWRKIKKQFDDGKFAQRISALMISS